MESKARAVMPNYIIACHGAGKFETPEQGAAARAKWKAWVGSLDEAVVNPGTSLVRGKLVSSDGASERGANFALQLAHPCQHLGHGTIEVAEIMEMK
jgi:hypothetical protein